MNSVAQSDLAVSPGQQESAEDCSGIRSLSAAELLTLQTPEETVEIIVPGGIEDIGLVVDAADRMCRRLHASDRFKHELVLAVREAFSLLCSDRGYITTCFHLLPDGLIVDIDAQFELRSGEPSYESAKSHFVLRSCVDEVEFQFDEASHLRLYKRLYDEREALSEPAERRPLITQLQNLGAPRRMCAWMKQQPSALSAWQSCQEPLWLLFLSEALQTPRRQQVTAVARCIEVRAVFTEDDALGAALEAALVEALDGYQLVGAIPFALTESLSVALGGLLEQHGVELSTEQRRLAELAAAVLRLGRALRYADKPGAVVYAAAVLQWALQRSSPDEERVRWCAHVMRRCLSPQALL